ncbi:MAG: hypothetical protein ABMB14_39650 [Myxococcota bacterium]
MACGMTVGRFPFTSWVTSLNDQWNPVGKEMTIVGGQELDYALTLTRVTSNATAIAATALMAARPDVVFGVNAASGAYAGAQGSTHHVTTLSTVNDKYLAQAGVLTKLASGATPGYISGYLSVVLRACASRIGTREIEVDPNQTNGAPRTYRLGRVPASGADKLRAAIVTNAAKDLEYLFFVRGVNDPDAPGVWVAIGTWAALADGASAICTTDAAVSVVTPSSYHMLEFGFAIRMKLGGSAPAGFVRVIAGLSYT